MIARPWRGLAVVLAACGTTEPSGTADLEAAKRAAEAPGYPGRSLLEVEDPLGDNTGPVDVRKMQLRWDQATGDYQITFFATGQAPFRGAIRVNVNLFNVDDGSFFQDAVNDFDFATPQVRLTLTGTDPTLTGWDAGERVHTNSLGGTPNPPGTRLFRTAVNGFPLEPLTNEDFVAFADLTQPAVVTLIGNRGE